MLDYCCVCSCIYIFLNVNEADSIKNKDKVWNADVDGRKIKYYYYFQWQMHSLTSNREKDSAEIDTKMWNSQMRLPCHTIRQQTNNIID